MFTRRSYHAIIGAPRGAPVSPSNHGLDPYPERWVCFEVHRQLQCIFINLPDAPESDFSINNADTQFPSNGCPVDLFHVPCPPAVQANVIASGTFGGNAVCDSIARPNAQN